MHQADAFLLYGTWHYGSLLRGVIFLRNTSIPFLFVQL